MYIEHRTPQMREERGAALVELALVIPIVLVLTIFVIEYVYILEQKQVLSTLNRESATMAFRECSRLTQPGLQGACMNRVRVYMETTGVNLLGRPPEIILAIYTRVGLQTTRASITPNGGITNNLHSTQFADNDPKFGSAPFQNAIGPSGRAVVGEIYLPYQPRLMSSIPYVWDLSLMTLYDLTTIITRGD